MSQVLIPPRAKIAIILGLAVVGVAFWKWDQKKSEVSAKPTWPEASGDFFPAPPSPTLTESPESSKASQPQLTAPSVGSSDWQNCLPQAETISNLTELLAASLPPHVQDQAETTIENLHVKTATGDELRLHQRISDLSKKPEMLLFGVDAQGYPESRPFPLPLQKQSFEEKRVWFLRQGRLVLAEKVRDLNVEGIHGRWREKNGEISELELIFPTQSLSCGISLSSCRCRR